MQFAPQVSAALQSGSASHAEICVQQACCRHVSQAGMPVWTVHAPGTVAPGTVAPGTVVLPTGVGEATGVGPATMLGVDPVGTGGAPSFDSSCLTSPEQAKSSAVTAGIVRRPQTTFGILPPALQRIGQRVPEHERSEFRAIYAASAPPPGSLLIHPVTGEERETP
jgi:hypothetical protein